MSKNKTKQVSKPRNRFAIDPIMAKGGHHEQSPKAKRKMNKQELRKELF